MQNCQTMRSIRFPSDIHVPTSLRNKLKHEYKTCTTNLSSLLSRFELNWSLFKETIIRSGEAGQRDKTSKHVFTKIALKYYKSDHFMTSITAA